MDIIIGNVFSFLGYLFDFFVSFKYNKKLIIIQGNLVSSTFSLASYLCLGAYDGVINCLVTLLRLFTIYIKDKYHKKFKALFVVFLLCYCLVFFKYSGIQTILLFLGGMCSFIPKWFSKDAQVLRVSSLCANILIIFYNLAINNYAAICIQILNIILIVITIYKWSKRRGSPKKGPKRKTK